MGNALFIVWRESVEAILVIGILYVWIREHHSEEIGLRHLWSGVVGGIAAAVFLAIAMLTVQTRLAGAALDVFQVAIVLAAAALITHMVLWMRHHGSRIKLEIEAGMQAAVTRTHGGLVAGALAAVAVAREGSETVLFLYGLVVERRGTEVSALFSGAVIGLLLALFTAWLIAKGRRFISWRIFFRSTEILLLLLAAGLLTTGIEKMIALEWWPPVVEPLYDSSVLLDEGSAVGSILASFTGYRARPALTLVLAYVAYWIAVWRLLVKSDRRSVPGQPITTRNQNRDWKARSTT